MLAVHPLIQALSPELLLILGAALLMILGLSKSRGVTDSLFMVALLSVAAAIYATVRLRADSSLPSTSLIDDGLVWYARISSLGIAILVLLTARHVPEPDDRGEFFGLILCSFAGVSLVPASNDLILLFLALELVSVPTYILVGLSRRDIRAQEATGKYFFLGAFAAAVTLYGFSFLYGTAGTTQLFGPRGVGPSLAEILPLRLLDPIAIIGLLLTLSGLAFKLAAVPLHFYVSDVYQGAASPVTGMLGFVPKFAGLLAIIRVLSLAGWNYDESLYWLIWGMAVLTMFVGNTLALWQNNVKRMLAYSGVAHSGYMLVGILAGPGPAGAGPMRNGVSATLFYMIVYGIMNLGAFAALSCFRKSGPDGEDSAETLDDLAGAARRRPWASLGLAICIISLTGLPPAGGFFGKLYVFSSALSAASGSPHGASLIVIVVLGVLNSAIAAAYYLRIIGACYLRSPADGVRPASCPALHLSLGLCAIIVVALFARPAALFDSADSATENLQVPPSSSSVALREHP